MSRRIAKIQKAALRQEDQAVTVGHLDHIDLLFDIGPLVVLQAGNLNLVVKVADVPDNRHVLHFAHMLDADHVFVACCGHKDISSGHNIFQCRHLIAVHGSLKRTDRINFCHNHTRTSAAQACRRAFANIAIAHNNRYFTRHHRVGRAADTVNKALFTAVFVIKL